MADETSPPTSAQPPMRDLPAGFRHDGVAHALRQWTPKMLCGLFAITRRQASVLRCFLENPNDARIARVLNLSPKTVSAHLDNVRKRLGVPCRLELMQHVLVKILTHGDHRPSLGKSPTDDEEQTD